MSVFRLSNVSFARAARTSNIVAARRPFHYSSVRAAGKESQVHNENRAQEAEDAKQAQIKAQKEGKGQWTETLASDSESNLKADKGEMATSKESIKELQDESVKAAERESKK